MIQRPPFLVQSPVIFEKTLIPEAFSLICWNIHKENLRPGFTQLIRKWKQNYGLDLILLQEARFSKKIFSIAGFPYVAAANIRLPGYYAGVITASGADPYASRHHRTRTREPIISTPKSTLITIYRYGESLLMVVNIHAINFRSLALYQWELSQLYNVIKGHKGPMVLAGDFNCWRRSRKRVLDRFARSLDLIHERPRYSGRVKNWFGHSLDRIYSRGLGIVDIKAIDCRQFSDHNPLIARFASPGAHPELFIKEEKTNPELSR